MIGKIALVATFFYLFLAILGVGEASAGGYAIPPQTAKTQSMGGAAVAGVDDPSAVYVNPGALTQIQGNQFLGGLTYVNTISSVIIAARHREIFTMTISCPISLAIITSRIRIWLWEWVVILHMAWLPLIAPIALRVTRHCARNCALCLLRRQLRGNRCPTFRSAPA